MHYNGYSRSRKSSREKEAERQQWYRDPRLMHLNEPYSLKEELKDLTREIYDRQLISNYADILGFNNWANEQNYMLEVCEAL